MGASGDTLYSARLEPYEWVQKGRDNVIKCPIYRDGALVAPASGTVSVYDDSNTAQVDGAAVTVSGSVAQYTIPTATLSGLEYATGWRIEWVLSLSSVSHTFRQEAAHVRAPLWPIISDTDLRDGRYSDLDDLRPSGVSSYQTYIDAAWRDVLDRLIAEGKWPHYIVTAAALRLPHLHRSLELIFLDFHQSAGADSKWLQLAEHHGTEWGRSFRSVRYTEDRDEDGAADSRRRKAAASVFWLNGRG